MKYFYELDAEKSNKIINGIVTIGEVSPSTAYMYMQGKRKPLPLYQKLICKLICKNYDVKVTRKELFVDSNVDFPQIVIEKGATKRGIQR